MTGEDAARNELALRITDRLRSKTPFFSFEFFPPKTDAGVSALIKTLSTLKTLDPAYVSVTYGAGGSTRDRSVEIAKRIKDEIGLHVMAHVTCSGSSADELRALFRELEAAGITNVLALRGDPAAGAGTFETARGGFAHANDLIALLEREFDFCIGGACYPEKHPEAQTLHADLDALERKVEAGARFLITQLFFDNAHYFEFVARVRARGIDVPIVPGIMPITNYDQISRFTAMCGATIPPGLIAELEIRRNEPEAVAELGVAFATLQCVELLEKGAPGVHFYTLNKSPATRAVVSALYASRLALLRPPSVPAAAP
jgi:methylenetetrahydrofolate reductase (NADPH)